MSVAVVGLRTNARVSPSGIDNPSPEFAWKLEADATDVVQSAYTVQMATSPGFDDVLWDTGRTPSDAQFGVRYGSPALESCRRYWWRARVWDGAGEVSEWSSPAWFETAVLDPSRWSATWITGTPPASEDDDAALYLRGTLQLPAPVVRARAYVSALGWYRLFVNGR